MAGLISVIRLTGDLIKFQSISYWKINKNYY